MALSPSTMDFKFEIIAFSCGYVSTSGRQYMPFLWRSSCRNNVRDQQYTPTVWNLNVIRSQILTRHLLLPKALQILRHLSRQRQVPGIEPFDLFDACAGILGKVEDVDLAM